MTGKKVKPIFSFYLSNVDGQAASVIIGGYNLTMYAKRGLSEKDILWHKLAEAPSKEQPNDYFWTLELAKVRLSGGTKVRNTHQQAKTSFKNGSKDELPITSSKLVLDTGMSFGTAPEADVKILTEMLTANYGVPCKPESMKDGRVYNYHCDC
jgi:hypothetical protein